MCCAGYCGGVESKFHGTDAFGIDGIKACCH